MLLISFLNNITYMYIYSKLSNPIKINNNS